MPFPIHRAFAAGQRLCSALVRLPLYLVAALVPRSKRIWVFGAWYGDRYADNSRYLFEHAAQHAPEVRVVWITRNTDILRALRSSGFEAHLANSWRGFWLSSRASLAVLTSGMRDVNAIGATGARHLQLWHGTPLKRIKYDDDINERSHAGFLRRAAKAIWQFLFPYTAERYDLTIAPSPEVQVRMASAFRLPKTAVPVTGWPRSDAVLAETPASVPLLSRLRERHPRARLICYAPTFRNDRTLLRDFWRSLDLEHLSRWLEQHDAVFVVKLHYIDRESLRESMPYADSRIVFANDSDVPDISLLLPHVDLLVTDYSSVYIDYLLLDRPIVFAPFDLARYVATERGLYEDYSSATPGPKCSTWDEILAEIEHAFAGRDDHQVQRLELRGRYSSHVDTRNSERVLAEARKLVGEYRR